MNGLVKDAQTNSLLPTVAKYIADRTAHAHTGIIHVTYVDLPTNSNLSAWMAKGSTDRTVYMSMSCSVWGAELYGRMGPRSPFGKYCRFCGSAIQRIRKPPTWVSISDTISYNGRNYFPRGKRVYFSPITESLNAQARENLVRILTRTPWWSATTFTRLMSWQVAVSSSGHMFTTDQIMEPNVATAHAGRS